MKNTNRIALILSVTAVAAVYFVMSAVGIGCPIKYLTGISCAGCGMTRAWISVMKLDFASAFKYHPLFSLPPLFVLTYAFRKKLGRKIFTAVSVVFAAVFAGVYLIRLFNPSDTVVTADLNSGYVGGFINLLR